MLSGRIAETMRMIHLDFRYLLSREEVVAKRSTFASTAIAPSVQGDQLAPTWPGRDNPTEARLPGSNSSKVKSNNVGNCRKKAPIAATIPIACTRPKINQYERFMPLLPSGIGHFVLNDLSALHYEFDSLKLGDVG